MQRGSRRLCGVPEGRPRRGERGRRGTGPRRLRTLLHPPKGRTPGLRPPLTVPHVLTPEGAAAEAALLLCSSGCRGPSGQGRRQLRRPLRAHLSVPDRGCYLPSRPLPGGGDSSTTSPPPGGAGPHLRRGGAAPGRAQRRSLRTPRSEERAR